MIKDQTPITLTGRYVFLPNPCTTEPCIPGMVYAIESGGQCFFITQGGCWSWQAHTCNGWTPSVGDAISVTGVVSQQIDVRRNPYYNIEVESLIPAAGLEPVD